MSNVTVFIIQMVEKGLKIEIALEIETDDLEQKCRIGTGKGETINSAMLAHRASYIYGDSPICRRMLSKGIFH
jgi:hypothetical protein